MGYDIFNAIAHIAMIILVLEIFVLLTVPVLGLGLGGLFGLRIGRRKLAGPLARVRPLAPLARQVVERGCNAAAWPVIQVTSIWRGVKAALASLRRQALQR